MIPNPTCGQSCSKRPGQDLRVRSEKWGLGMKPTVTKTLAFVWPNSAVTQYTLAPAKRHRNTDILESMRKGETMRFKKEQYLSLFHQALRWWSQSPAAMVHRVHSRFLSLLCSVDLALYSCVLHPGKAGMDIFSRLHWCLKIWIMPIKVQKDLTVTSTVFSLPEQVAKTSQTEERTNIPPLQRP